MAASPAGFSGAVAGGHLICGHRGYAPEKWKANLRGNQALYNTGQRLRAAATCFHPTDRDRPPKVTPCHVDHLDTTFGPHAGQTRGQSGRQDIELARIKAYHATGLRQRQSEVAAHTSTK